MEIRWQGAWPNSRGLWPAESLTTELQWHSREEEPSGSGGR